MDFCHGKEPFLFHVSALTIFPRVVFGHIVFHVPTAFIIQTSTIKCSTILIKEDLNMLYSSTIARGFYKNSFNIKIFI